MTTFKPEIKLFLRRAFNPDVAFANWTAATRLTWENAWALNWRPGEIPIAQTKLTENRNLNGTQFMYDSDAFPVMRQSVCYAPSRMSIAASIAAYRLEMPPEAMVGGLKIEHIKFFMSADRDALGGINAGVFFSDSPTPPAGFDACRQGGVDGAVCVSGIMKTGEEDFVVTSDWDPRKTDTGKVITTSPGADIPTRIGVLAPTRAVIAENANDSKTFTIHADLSIATRMYKYAYIIVSMFHPVAWRQTYWVEGSAYIQADTIEATTQGDWQFVDRTPFKDRYGFRTALNMAVLDVGGNPQSPDILRMPSKYLRSKYPIISLTDKFFGIGWATKQGLIEGDGNLLLGGTVAEGEVGSDIATVVDVDRPALAPSVWVGPDGNVHVRKSMAFFSCPDNIPEGHYVWINFTNDSFLGKLSTLRILVYASDVSSGGAAVWNGGGAVGMRELRGDEVVPGWFGIRVKAFGATQRLTICAAISEIAREDIHTQVGIVEEAGFVARIGFDLRDAHISRELSPVITGGWGNYTPDPIIDPLSPVLTALALTGFTANGIALVNDAVDLGEVAYPLDVTFAAQFSGTAFPLQKATGEPEFWTLAPTPNAQFVSRDEMSCVVRFTNKGQFTLNYKAGDAKTPPTQLAGAVAVDYAGPPVFEIVSAGSISPPGPFVINEDVPAPELTLGGVNVTRNGIPTENYAITWMESITNDGGQNWTAWATATGNTGENKFTPTMDTVSERRYCARITQNEAAVSQKYTQPVFVNFNESTYYILNEGWILPGSGSTAPNVGWLRYNGGTSKPFTPQNIIVIRNEVDLFNGYQLKWEARWRFVINPITTDPQNPIPIENFSEWETIAIGSQCIINPQSFQPHPWFGNDGFINGVNGEIKNDYAQVVVELRYKIILPTGEFPQSSWATVPIVSGGLPEISLNSIQPAWQ